MHGLGKCGFVDKAAVQEAERQPCSFIHSTFHEQVMPSEVVLMLLFAHKVAAAYPPSTELQLDLFHPPRWWDLLCLFVQPPAHSAPWCPQSAAHAQRAASWSGLWVRSRSVEESIAVSWVDPGLCSLQYHAVRWTISPCSHMLSTALLLVASLQICKRLHGPCTFWQSCLLIAMFT